MSSSSVPHSVLTSLHALSDSLSLLSSSLSDLITTPSKTIDRAVIASKSKIPKRVGTSSSLELSESPSQGPPNQSASATSQEFPIPNRTGPSDPHSLELPNQNNSAPNQEFSALDRATVHLTRSHLFHTLYCVLLQLNGTDVGSEDRLTKESKRLKAFTDKVDASIERETLRKSRSKTSVNVSATNRFLEHAIPELTNEQRRKMREASRKAQERQEERKRRFQEKRGENEEGKAVGREREGGKEAGEGGGKKQKTKSIKEEVASFLCEIASLQEGEKQREEREKIEDFQKTLE